MDKQTTKKISFLGFGTFNCAVAHYLTEKFAEDDSYNFFFWDIDENIFNNFQTNRVHPYHFQEHKFNEKLQGCQNKGDLIKDSDIVIIGISAQNISEALSDIKAMINKDMTFVIISKGIDNKTHELLSVIVKKNIKDSGFNNPIAVFSGGTIATDIINKAPLVAEIACQNNLCTEEVANLFHSKTLRIYTNNDVLSVEIAGALKNFISIGAGICEGLGFSVGTKASFITRAAFDVYKIAKKMGASDTTFLPGSASFWGDIMLSSFGDTRNREFGKRLCTDSKTPLEIIDEMEKEHKTVEGYYTVKAAYEIAQENQIETPSIELIYQIVYENADPLETYDKMMNKDRKKLGI
ncbi:MAG: NAD(P)H-dependent glycerol-3-phosphate dehydrogenase [Patescibacteria group bacterium]|nr:NAD(P)H-dependent glycerol-3-phosphate dehydrogenase [Patescibacteria group bacterium]